MSADELPWHQTHPQVWTEEKIALLRKLFPDVKLSVAVVARRLGVTTAAAHSAADRYDVKRDATKRRSAHS